MVWLPKVCRVRIGVLSLFGNTSFAAVVVAVGAFVWLTIVGLVGVSVVAAQETVAVLTLLAARLVVGAPQEALVANFDLAVNFELVEALVVPRLLLLEWLCPRLPG